MLSFATRERENPEETLLARTDDNELVYFNRGAGFLPFPVVSISGKEWKPDFLKNGRLTLFIAGVPGAGKSYLAKEMIKTLPPDYDILLFTALTEEDGNFGDFGKRLYKIKMEPENLQRMTLDQIRKVSKHPILLFDDVDKIRDKKVQQLMFAILDDALANGRGHTKHDGEGDIHVITTSHALNDYIKTKYSLENSDYIALFPASTTFCQLKRIFEKIGLSKELCEQMVRESKQGKFRSIIVHKTAPMYIIFGNQIMLL